MRHTTCKKYDAVLLLSGGIDSNTMLHKLVSEGKRVFCLIFDYGQSLRKEIRIAKRNAKELGQDYKVIKINLKFSDSKCSLISKTKIDTNKTFTDIDKAIPTSYVEFRNGILLSYAVMFAECHDIHHIYGGFNGLDSGQYYDDTYEFIKAFEISANLGTAPRYDVKIHAPFSKMHKWDIVKLGLKLGMDYDKTWSCYKNGLKHCGYCDSCKQRKRALILGGYHEEV